MAEGRACSNPGGGPLVPGLGINLVGASLGLQLESLSPYKLKLSCLSTSSFVIPTKDFGKALEL